MFQVAVCDDEFQIHKLLKEYFYKLHLSSSYEFDVRYFSSGENLIQYHKDDSSHRFHILIMDIEMKGKNGLETARSIRALPDRDAQLMFLTSYPQYMMDSFDVQTAQYAMKPLCYAEFQMKLLKICHYISTTVSRFFLFKGEDGQLVIRAADIIALVKIKQTLIQNRIRIVTINGEYCATGTLTGYMDKLGAHFLSVHRSIIINLEHVSRFNSFSVVMSNHEEFPVGRTQSKTLKVAYTHYMTAHFRERG